MNTVVKARIQRTQLTGGDGLTSKEKTCKKTGVSATRDAGDEIVCAAMRVLLLCAAFESCRSSVSLAVAFAGMNLFFFFAFFTLRALLVLLYGFTTKVVCRKSTKLVFNKLPYQYHAMYKRKKEHSLSEEKHVCVKLTYFFANATKMYSCQRRLGGPRHAL